MQTAFLEAVVNRVDHRVLGRRLDAFCLYHALFLTIAANPLWVGGRAATLADLQEAVLICSLPPERFLSARLGPQTIREAFASRSDLAAELALFTSFVSDFHSLPEHWSASGKGKSLRAPWILSLACYIEAHSNMTEREIMTAPIGLMHWKAEAIAERRGENVSDLMTDDELAIGLEQAEAMAAAGETFPADDPEDGEP
jgi:hypothetical protein